MPEEKAQPKREQPEETLLDKITALSKRRGFIYQGSEIYGGLAGTWDYGPLGVALKNNIKNLWWNTFVDRREDMYGIDTAVIMSGKVWKASGHTETFSDPMVECEKCKKRFREDILADKTKCPECGGKLTAAKQFNLLFPVSMGALADENSTAYLRGEIAQGMFVNFKNILDTFHPRLPFGIAAVGRAFRNEIAPRDFIFRVREFDLMEFEYFVKESEWEKYFEYWRQEMWRWIDAIGLSRDRVHELEIAPEDRAHYSKRTIDFEFDFPFGKKELYGLAYRTDFDLKNHTEASRVDLSYFDEEGKERFMPHVIEPTFGLDRTVLAVLSQAYSEDEMGGEGEKRIFLKIEPKIAPIKAAVFPLLKNKPELVSKARAIYAQVAEVFPAVMFDDNGNIGKRYRRQDEIGTPFCITVDFRTLEEETVTLRDRDTGKQDRINVSELTARLRERIL
jgi:glycyl-tRNA synthetase